MCISTHACQAQASTSTPAYRVSHDLVAQRADEVLGQGGGQAARLAHASARQPSMVPRRAVRRLGSLRCSAQLAKRSRQALLRAAAVRALVRVELHLPAVLRGQHAAHLVAEGGQGAC